MNHQVKITNNGGTYTEMEIDGVMVQNCIHGYDVSQMSGQAPKITLDIVPAICLEVKGELSISHLGDLARVMDEEMFKEFNALWRGLHDGV